jgi:hypothetical protein
MREEWLFLATEWIYADLSTFDKIKVVFVHTMNAY